jgi:hypothetical protein
MSRILRRRAGLVVAAALIIGATSAVPAAMAAPASDADGIAAAITSAAPLALGQQQVATANHGKGKPTDTVGGDVEVTTPATGNGKVSVTSRHGRGSVRFALPAAADTQASVSADGTVTYAGDVPVGVRVFDSGVQVSTVIGAADSAHTFSYPLDLPAGSHIEPAPDGGVLFIGADGGLLGGFAAPWAKDAAGTAVPTHYTFDGTTVTQVVDHVDGAQYPVVADPYLWIDLISSASWQYNSGYGWTLRVSPTAWARANAGSHQVGIYDWNELYSKYKNSGLNTNLGGMEDQLICHQEFVAIWSPTKSTWNLDEWRPDVSYLATVNARCNPGGSTIFD